MKQQHKNNEQTHSLNLNQIHPGLSFNDLVSRYMAYQLTSHLSPYPHLSLNPLSGNSLY